MKMSSIIYKITAAALRGQNTAMLQFELGEKINNQDVAEAIVASIKQAIDEWVDENDGNDDESLNLEDYQF